MQQLPQPRPDNLSEGEKEALRAVKARAPQESMLSEEEQTRLRGYAFWMHTRHPRDEATQRLLLHEGESHGQPVAGAWTPPAGWHPPSEAH